MGGVCSCGRDQSALGTENEAEDWSKASRRKRAGFSGNNSQSQGKQASPQPGNLAPAPHHSSASSSSSEESRTHSGWDAASYNRCSLGATSSQLGVPRASPLANGSSSSYTSRAAGAAAKAGASASAAAAAAALPGQKQQQGTPSPITSGSAVVAAGEVVGWREAGSTGSSGGSGSSACGGRGGTGGPWRRRQESLFGLTEPQPLAPVKDTQQLVLVKVAGCTFVNQYLVVKYLGRGSCGRVFLCMSVHDHRLYAVKIVKKGDLEGRPGVGAGAPARRRNPLEDLRREIAVMRRMQHPNVVALREVVDDDASSKMLLVMDYMEGGPVMTREGLERGHRIPEPVARLYFRHMLRGLEHLHRNRVVHGDLKPENALMSGQGGVALSDFGCSKELASEDEILDRCNGTPAFLAPEMMKPNARFKGPPADVYALGACLYTFVFGRIPFTAPTVMKLFEVVLSTPLTFPPGGPVTASPGLQELLLGMLAKDPSQRLTLEAVMSHPWVTLEGKHPPISSTQQRRRQQQPTTKQDGKQQGAERMQGAEQSRHEQQQAQQQAQQQGGQHAQQGEQEGEQQQQQRQRPGQGGAEQQLAPGGYPGWEEGGGDELEGRQHAQQGAQQQQLASGAGPGWEEGGGDELEGRDHLWGLVVPGLEVVRYKRGEHIFRQGERGSHLVVILEGECEVRYTPSLYQTPSSTPASTPGPTPARQDGSSRRAAGTAGAAAARGTASVDVAAAGGAPAPSQPASGAQRPLPPPVTTAAVEGQAPGAASTATAAGAVPPGSGSQGGGSSHGGRGDASNSGSTSSGSTRPPQGAGAYRRSLTFADEAPGAPAAAAPAAAASDSDGLAGTMSTQQQQQQQGVDTSLVQAHQHRRHTSSAMGASLPPVSQPPSQPPLSQSPFLASSPPQDGAGAGPPAAVARAPSESAAGPAEREASFASLGATPEHSFSLSLAPSEASFAVGPAAPGRGPLDACFSSVMTSMVAANMANAVVTNPAAASPGGAGALAGPAALGDSTTAAAALQDTEASGSQVLLVSFLGEGDEAVLAEAAAGAAAEQAQHAEHAQQGRQEEPGEGMAAGSVVGGQEAGAASSRGVPAPSPTGAGLKSAGPIGPDFDFLAGRGGPKSGTAGAAAAAGTAAGSAHAQEADVATPSFGCSPAKGQQPPPFAAGRSTQGNSGDAAAAESSPAEGVGPPGVLQPSHRPGAQQQQQQQQQAHSQAGAAGSDTGLPELPVSRSSPTPSTASGTATNSAAADGPGRQFSSPTAQQLLAPPGPSPQHFSSPPQQQQLSSPAAGPPLVSPGPHVRRVSADIDNAYASVATPEKQQHGAQAQAPEGEGEAVVPPSLLEAAARARTLVADLRRDGGGSGSVQFLVGVRRQGQVLGEMEVLGGSASRRAASAVAHTRVRAALVPYAAAKEYLHKNPLAKQQLAELMWVRQSENIVLEALVRLAAVGEEEAPAAGGQ